MGEWVVTVAGIAIISVLCDVILSEGQTRKYIKTVFGIVVILVIVQPIVALLDGEIDLWEEDVQTEVQEQYLLDIKERQDVQLARSVQNLLVSNGFTPISVTVSGNDITVTMEDNEPDQLNSAQSIVSRYFPQYKVSII